MTKRPRCQAPGFARSLLSIAPQRSWVCRATLLTRVSCAQQERGTKWIHRWLSEKLQNAPCVVCRIRWGWKLFDSPAQHPRTRSTAHFPPPSFLRRFSKSRNRNRNWRNEWKAPRGRWQSWSSDSPPPKKWLGESLLVLREANLRFAMTQWSPACSLLTWSVLHPREVLVSLTRCWQQL